MIGLRPARQAPQVLSGGGNSAVIVDVGLEGDAVLFCLVVCRFLRSVSVCSVMLWPCLCSAELAFALWSRLTDLF